MQMAIIGLKDTNKTLKNIKDKVEDTRPLLNELENHLTQIIKESFENEQSPDGKAWSPIKYRKNDKHPDKILYDEGDMQRSLYARNSGDEVVVGFNAVSGGFQYPLAHQFGRIDGSIKARPFMPIHEDGGLYAGIEKELMGIVGEYLEFVV